MSAEVQEHRQNLQEYKSQLEQVLRSVTVAAVGPFVGSAEAQILGSLRLQVESLLLSEPDNEEYADIHNSLTEVRGSCAAAVCDLSCCSEDCRPPAPILLTDPHACLQVIQLTENLLSEALKNAQAAGAAPGRASRQYDNSRCEPVH